jgi:hypothetical protein
MISYEITSVTGWLMLVFLVAIIAYPFLLRAGFLGLTRPFLVRMRFHYWLAYILAGVLCVHLLASMSKSMMAAVNGTGLYLATVAMFLVVVQIWLGRQLASPRLALRRLVRRWHFWMMLVLVGFILAHVVLDSPMLQVLLARR